MSFVHAFIGLSAYLSVCVCLSLCYLFISFYYGFIPDSNKWNGLDWIGNVLLGFKLRVITLDTISCSHIASYQQS